MEAFVIFAGGLTIGVNRVVEVIKALLDRYLADLQPETRHLILLVAQLVVGLGAFAVAFSTNAIVTGTRLDDYPALVIFVGGVIAAYGGDFWLQVIQALDRVNKPTPPVG